MVVVFWQNRPSIHQQPLLTELSKLGVQVIQVVAEGISQERAAMGWKVQDADYETRMCHETVPLEILRKYPNAFHVFTGFQAFPLVGRALDLLYAKVPERCYVFQERPDTRGANGMLRVLLYRWYCYRYRRLGGILAAGSVGFFSRIAGRLKVVPFSYYVYPPDLGGVREVRAGAPFRFLYIGALIHRKNIDGMCDAFQDLAGPWELVVVGDGPERDHLEALATARPECTVLLRGVLNNAEIGPELREADCLVLPSRFDGYGVVVNEAALSGLQIICSSMAGASEWLVRLGLELLVMDPFSKRAMTEAFATAMAQGCRNGTRRIESRRAASVLEPASGARALLLCLSGAPEISTKEAA